MAHGAEQQRGDKAGQRAGEHRHEQEKRQVSERRGRAEREHRGGDLSAVVRRRTGKLFAHQNYGVEPDTCSMAKALGSGVPIGAVCARGEAAKTLTPGTHGSTFAGGPLACALAATTLDVMINDGVIENSRKMGEYFRKQAHEIIEKNHPETVNEIRGLGLIDGIQLNKPSGQPVVDLCFKDSKVLINNTNGNVLRFVPPLIVNEEEIDIVIKAVDEAMAKLGW